MQWDASRHWKITMATCVILLNVCRPTERSDSAVHRKSQLCHSVFQQPTLASTTPKLVIIFHRLLLSSSPLPPPNRMSPAWLASHLVPKTDAQGSCIPSQSYLRQLSCDSFFTGASPSPDCGLLREPPMSQSHCLAESPRPHMGF